jgi:hypothetical protein
VRRDDEPVRPAAGIVVLRRKLGDRGGEVVGERGTLGGPTKGDLGVDGEGRQPRAVLITVERGDLVDQPCRNRDEVARPRGGRGRV